MSTRAIRAVVDGELQAESFREATVRRARELEVMGWVRDRDEGGVQVHAEGSAEALDAFEAFLHDGRVVEIERVKVEGHEQFAMRGVSAGVFVVQEHQATAHHYDL